MFIPLSESMMQFGLAGNNPQRSHASQMLSDQSMSDHHVCLLLYFIVYYFLEKSGKQILHPNASYYHMLIHIVIYGIKLELSWVFWLQCSIWGRQIQVA